MTLSSKSQRKPMIHQSTRDARDEDDRISNKTSHAGMIANKKAAVALGYTRAPAAVAGETTQLQPVTNCDYCTISKLTSQKLPVCLPGICSGLNFELNTL